MTFWLIASERASNEVPGLVLAVVRFLDDQLQMYVVTAARFW